MATLEQLEERKRELEERLADGDLSAEAALTRIDAAIRARAKKVQHGRKRVAAVKEAVAKGMSPEKARNVKPQTRAKKLAARQARKPLNRFE